MIADELLTFVQKKTKSKAAANARFLWRNMERAIKTGKEGRIGFRRRDDAKEENLCRLALNCALLHNGLNFQWMPLSPKVTITEARKRKKKPLPSGIHNWMMLVSANQWTRQYLNLMEGIWTRRT